MIADLVLINANVITMASCRPKAGAVAIKNEKIIKVGTEEEINQFIGADTTVLNLHGKTLVPGFIDAHIHVTDFGKFLTWVDMKNVNSIKEMQKRIRDRVQKIHKGRWIIGSGWDQTCFAENRYPDFCDLDEASPDNPVILYHRYGRVCVVNSKALELAGLHRETVVQSDGEIEKDSETGKLTGILRGNATDLIWKIIPDPSEKELVEQINLACKKILEAGVTTIHWIVASFAEISIIHNLLLNNELPLHVHIIAPVNILDNLSSSDSPISFKESSSRILGVKIFIDGSLAARTAALREPYNDSPLIKGEPMYSQKELNELVLKVHKAHFRLVMHAMGDQAIELALTAVQNALIKEPRKNHRHRFEHASVLNKDLIQCIKKLGIIVSVQPKCVISEFSVWSAIDRLGSKRARWLYPLNALTREGIRVVGGSDCPMEPISPLLGIQAAVDRQFFTQERISVNDALSMYTINAAYASSEEANKGSIEEGKIADLTILSDDPRRVPSNEIGSIKVNATIVNGKVVFQKLS